MPENEDIDFRPENPYTKSYFEFASEQGDKLVNNLKTNGLTPDQISAVLSNLAVLAGMTGAVSEKGMKAKRENGKVMEQGADWVNTVVAGAQQSLAEKTGVKPASGNDMRNTNSSPLNKYRPPTR